MPEFAYIEQTEFVTAMVTLAGEMRSSGWTPDFIVGVGRGGLTPGVFMSHATEIPLLSVDYSAKIAGFSDELLVKLAQRTAEGTRLLFVDDINDTGMTIAHLRRALAAAGGDAQCVRFAVMIDNSRSAEQVDYRFRTIDRSVDKRWFVFPWEAVASKATLAEEADAVPERLS